MSTDLEVNAFQLNLSIFLSNALLMSLPLRDILLIRKQRLDEDIRNVIPILYRLMSVLKRIETKYN